MGFDIEAHFAAHSTDPVREAFTRRRAVMPWRNKSMLPAAQITDVWAQLRSQAGSDGARLAYVHIPFCANHCLFCGFYRNAYSADVTSSYTDLLLAEIAGDARWPMVNSAPVDAVYLGGGTPSALSAAELSQVLHSLRRHLPLTDDCEITLEGRITHFDPEKIQACLDAGVNRISIGVQTFNTRVRRRQGRKSTREEVIRFMEALRQQDRAAVVLDLLYGLPGQTPDIWQDDLQTALALAPDGVDLYGLNIIPGTPLHQSINTGKFERVPELPDLGDMYRLGVETFQRAGWEQLSNSHWRSTPRECSRYNLRIKEGRDCIAYGSGAGGQLGKYSYVVHGALEDYATDVKAGTKPLGGMYVADDFQSIRQLVTAGFEVGRLDAAALREVCPPSLHEPCDMLLRQWMSAGLLQYDGRVALLTIAGRFWYSNLVFAFDALLGSLLDTARRPGKKLQPLS